ncbi:3-oxoacyl-[acyl-carrier-protein] synthase III C-terminal domain-containing protein [Actinoallomurus sp. NPDC050550]|uniref:3-oxoacyl-[acyl-carrier-protein] synthase III C-terminal domain-containing protein n=1 Tax=Actinoallomurus sp. NPDC050550 TaxID=3154937 RepID=UPI0033D561E0
MTALVEVATHLPAADEPVRAVLERTGRAADAADYERYYGFRRVRREPGGDLTGQLRAAALGLRTLRDRARDVRYVVHAPTIQFTAPYPGSLAGRVARSLGLDHAVPFSLSQHACASALLAVEVCGALLADAGDAGGLALVLAGERTFTEVAQVIHGSAVMGEGTAAVLVRAGGDRDRLLAYETRTLGEFHRSPYLPSEDEAQFQSAYPGTLVEVVREALRRAGLTVADVKVLLPHNVNRVSWLRVRRDLGLPRDGVLLDNQPELGHCFGADPFVNYRTACDAGRLAPGDHYVMTAAGLGATLTAMVFRH